MSLLWSRYGMAHRRGAGAHGLGQGTYNPLDDGNGNLVPRTMLNII